MQTLQKWLAQKTNQSVLWWLLGGLLFRGFVAFWLYPGFDEAYYYLYSIHLDWSYFDHPVLVALLTGFGPWLTGDVSQFTIRLGTLILHTGSLILLYLTSAKLFSEKAARMTLAIATLVPIFQVAFGILTLPDVPLMFFWTASLYCAAQEFFRQPTPSQNYSGLDIDESQPSIPYQPSYRLAILGVLVGLACLGKYHGFVLGFGFVGFCLTSSRYRSALLSPWAWLGVGLLIVTIFPIWFWNIQHDWVSFRFQLNRGVPHREFSLLKVGIVFLSGVAYLFPTFGLPLWWVTLRSIQAQIRQLFSKKSWPEQSDFQQKQLLILWVSLPLTLGFTLMGGYQQILPTWPMPGFWSLTLLLGEQAVIWQQQSRRWVRRWLKGSGFFIGTCLLLALLHVATGTLQSGSRYAVMGGFWQPQDDPSTELIDIQQLRRGFAESPLLTKALHDSGFIFTNGYYLAGQIAMALTPLAHTPITCFAPDMRGFAFWSKSEQWLGQDALYITLDRFYQKKELTDRYRDYFKNLQEIGTVPIRRGGGVIEVIHVSQAKTLLKPYPRPYGI
ncbi:ArnT family glycosyltransferase [Allocoleopsis sp.]|uniref:ArnT family glycosyltransferase n=1 Tax=Allocoleopsis sp. TaxID=3088169 RepID=UPI002FD41CCF